MFPQREEKGGQKGTRDKRNQGDTLSRGSRHRPTPRRTFALVLDEFRTTADEGD